MFNLYFAGSRNKIADDHIIQKRGCRLFSYLNESKDIAYYLTQEQRGLLLIDSGAFSVAHANAVVDIDKYIQYINSNTEIEYYIELDEIPYPVLNIETARESSEASWRNYLYMIERLDDPLKLLPVFHFGEPITGLKRMLSYKVNGTTPIPYICIGGRHGVSTSKQEDYFRKMFTIIHESPNPNVKVHVLGMTVFSTLEKFPMYSADSTTYLKIAAFGGILTDSGIINLSTKNNNLDNYKAFDETNKSAVMGIIEKFGYTIEQLTEDTNERLKFNIDYCMDWANDYTYKGPKSFKHIKSLF